MDLERYFDRIGYGGVPRADLATLRELHLLHAQTFAFENLSTLLGDPVRLDIASLEEKLVRQGRGGYCFEQNTLFRHVLEALGFPLVPLAARVVWNPDAPPNPRTHMALLVKVDGHDYLCDVGFGGATLTGPLLLAIDVEQPTPHETCRIGFDDGIYELSIQLGERWRQVYQFDLQPQRTVDYEAMNHYVQTHASSPFRRVLMAGRPDSRGRFALGGNRLTRYEGGLPVEQRSIISGSELAAVLSREFGLRLPEHEDLGSLLARIAAAPDV